MDFLTPPDCCCCNVQTYLSRGRWYQTRWIDLYCLLSSSLYIHCFLNCVYSGLCYSVDRPKGWIGKRSKAELSCLGWFVSANKFTSYPNKIKSLGAIQLFMVFQGEMTMKRKSKSRNVKEMKCPTKPPRKTMSIKTNKNKGCRNRYDFLKTKQKYK